MEFRDNLYALLEIPPDADDQIIKAAYRQMARRYHPDTSQESDSTERFLAVQKAYEVLADPIQRRAYDLWRRQQGLDRPLPLRLTVTSSHQVLPCSDEAQALYILAEISASDEWKDNRLALNLVLVVDCSTSMKGIRLQQVKQGVSRLIDHLNENDVLALVAFNDKAELVLPGQKNLDKRAAKAAMLNLRARGGTELFRGMEVGFREANRWHDSNRHTHLILLTDGHTYGDEEGCLAIARAASQQRIALTMMGIGSDWNEDLLDEMANLSHGLSIYVDSPVKITQVLQDQFHSLSHIAAQNVVLSAHLSKQVALRDAHQTSPKIRPLFFEQETMNLGALAHGEPLVVMLELLLDSHPPGDHRVLQLDVQATAQDLQPLHLRHQVTVAFDAHLISVHPIPAEIVTIQSRLVLFRMQQKAMQEIAQGQIELAATRLTNLSTRLLDLGEVELARAALLEAGHLARSGSLSPTGAKKIRYGTRDLPILPREG